MRIAQVAPPWFAVPPTGYGGIEWVVSLLADGLAERGHDVTLYASGGTVTKANLVSPFDEPPGGPHIGETFYEAVHALTAYRDRDQFDIIHDHCGVFGPALGALCGKPVVHTLHGPFTEAAKRLYRLMSPPVHLVAISESQRSGCPDLDYAATVYNGIDLRHHTLNTDKEDFLLFVGRVNHEKGPEVAVEVAARAGMKLRMVVKMTEDHEKDYWHQIVEPRLTGSEEILGEVTNGEKVELLSRARGVLFPIQWSEPFGLVMTEAMASGTPVIAFARGAAPEVIVDGQTGFLVNTVDEMVEAVFKLDQISPQACRDHVAGKFSAEKMVEGYEQAFQKILAG